MYLLQFTCVYMEADLNQQQNYIHIQYIYIDIYIRVWWIFSPVPTNHVGLTHSPQGPKTPSLLKLPHELPHLTARHTKGISHPAPGEIPVSSAVTQWGLCSFCDPRCPPMLQERDMGRWDEVKIDAVLLMYCKQTVGANKEEALHSCLTQAHT